MVVGTPGRIMDLVTQGRVSLSRVEYLVLDEADEMLDAGFAPAVEKMLGLTYEPQTVLASATMPTWVTRMIEKHTHDAAEVRVDAEKEADLEHGLLRVAREYKLQTLSRVLHRHGGSAIVFGRTARMGVAGRALTFVTPDDELAWVKLSRQGAPDIRELNAKLFLDEGSWQYQEHRPASAPRSAVPQARNIRRSRGPRWPASNRSGRNSSRPVR